MEKVKEKQIHRGKRTENAADHEVQQEVKLLNPVRDITGTADCGKRHHGPHENDPNVDSVCCEMKIQPKTFDPHPFGFKLQFLGIKIK